MIFKFPKKKIVLDCFTKHEYVIKSAPIVNAIKVIPDWWKTLPVQYSRTNEIYPKSTMKNCVGMVDYYKKSVAISLWSELALKIKSSKDFEWQFSDLQSVIGHHDLEKEATGFLNDYAHFKLLSPWIFSTKEDINWVWSCPLWNFFKSHEIVFPPAIVNYKHQHGTHINLLIYAGKPKTIIIPHGQPLIFISPMSDRKVEIVRHLVSPQEFERRGSNGTPISFIKKYQKQIDTRSKFNDCPFHNHVGK